MEKDLGLIELYELYKGLLTERQRELFECYYLYDLSLAEISEPEGKTRQNVYENLKKVKEKLNGYERALGLKEKNDKFIALAESLEKTDSNSAQKIFNIIGR